MKFPFAPKNLRTLSVYRKAQKFRDVLLWRNIFQNLTSAIIDRQDERGRPKKPAEKIVWLAVHVVAVFGMMLLILDITLVYKRSPTVTTPETMLFPVQQINYPAIAICNVNRISHAAIKDFAKELLDFKSTVSTVNLTLPELTRMLNMLSQLYLHAVDETDSETKNILHTILERGYDGYDVDILMKRLSPQCRYMLQGCRWEGKDQICNDVFLLRKTEDGYCCTFNYARRNNGFGSAQDDVFTSQHIKRSINIGSEYGLSVLLDPQLNDYAYTTLPINGFKVLVYNPLDYPDVPSGSVSEIVISPRTETFIELKAFLFYSTEDVIQYSIVERDCLFQTEQSQIFHGYYSFSDCIVHCRMQYILEQCDCVPFFFPLVENIASARICNLKDLSCLNKYRERWHNVKLRRETSMTPFHESYFAKTSDYHICDCLPSCSDVTYNVKSSSIPLSLSKLSWGREKYVIGNHSVMHIYFGNSGALRLRQDVLFYWYELMSNYGGVCSLCLGISIIKVIGILYELIARVWDSGAMSRAAARTEEKNREDHDIARVTTIAVRSAAIPPEVILHWREITDAIPKERLDPSNLLLNSVSKQ